MVIINNLSEPAALQFYPLTEVRDTSLALT